MFNLVASFLSNYFERKNNEKLAETWVYLIGRDWKRENEIKYKTICEEINWTLPDGWVILLEPENQNDKACNWRTFKLYNLYNRKSIKFGLALDWNNHDLIVKQYIKVLNEENKMIMMFGKTEEEILEAINFKEKFENFSKEKGFQDDLQKGIEITREAAIDKMKEIFSSKSEDSGRNIVDFIDGLAALGLIKFKEPEKDKYIFFPNPDKGKNNVGVKSKDVFDTLRLYGYTVIRI